MGSGGPSEEELVQIMLQYFLRDTQSILGILEQPDPSLEYSICINFLDLAQQSIGIADALLMTPRLGLDVLDQAISQAQQIVAENHLDSEHLVVKSNLRIRLKSLPFFLDPANPGIGGIRTYHTGRLITLAGTVVKTGAIQTMEALRIYECTKCRHRFAVQPDFECPTGLDLPVQCPSADHIKACQGRKFVKVSDDEPLHTDYQEIKLQERSQCLAMGAMPRAIAVLLQNDLADSCQPGEEVEATGVVIQRWQRTFPGQTCNVDLVMLANGLHHVNARHMADTPSVVGDEMFIPFWQAHEDCPLLGRNKIVASMCPQVYGLFIVKLATLLMLIGGPRQEDERGTHVRGEVHMLLIGDPGTGKSQFMKYAAKVASRAVVTTGAGSSAAGLTVTAVKEGGAWALEAGALVLADGGLCCIDEFDGLREQDRTTIHEAMEQQSISIAKAGLVTSLSTRTTVLGVMNPSGRYKADESLADITNLSGPLLSRFDIILTLRDTRDPNWDAVLCEHVLESRQNHDAANEAQGWNIATLQRYIQWVKNQFQPIVSPEAEAILQAYFQLQRQAYGRHAARVTVRMLESLVRISQAHARLMARDTVVCQDAIVACMVVDFSMHTASVLGQVNALHSDFPEDPDANYVELEKRMKGAIFASAFPGDF